MSEPLKGISTPQEVERLSNVINQVSDSVSKGDIPAIQFTPKSAPDVQLNRVPEGYTYYDKDLKKLRTWDGTNWNNLF